MQVQTLDIQTRDFGALARRALSAVSRRARLLIGGAFLPLMLLSVSPSAHAVDGCQLLLCISGNWKQIPMCVPTVKQALHDMALGHGWPECNMGGAGNNANFSWANATNCPIFYSQFNADNGQWTSCTYPMVISVNVNNSWWDTVFADFSGNTSTNYSDYAKSQLTQNGGTIDPTYDNDAAAYQPPPPPDNPW
jgi:hypothetical protein